MKRLAILTLLAALIIGCKKDENSITNKSNKKYCWDCEVFEEYLEKDNNGNKIAILTVPVLNHVICNLTENEIKQQFGNESILYENIINGISVYTYTVSKHKKSNSTEPITEIYDIYNHKVKIMNEYKKAIVGMWDLINYTDGGWGFIYNFTNDENAQYCRYILIENPRHYYLDNTYKYKFQIGGSNKIEISIGGAIYDITFYSNDLFVLKYVNSEQVFRRIK